MTSGGKTRPPRKTRPSLDLGWFDLCLNVRDLRRSRDFYRKLGFRRIDGRLEDRWLLLSNGEVRLGLYQGHIRTNLLNFRGGDAFAIARTLESVG